MSEYQIVGAFTGGFFFLLIALVVLNLIGSYKLYEKAGQPGFIALIPVINFIYYLKIAKVPLVSALLMLIPFVSIGYAIYISYKFVDAFGGGVGLLLAYLFFPPFTSLYMAFNPNVEYVD